MMDDDLNLLNEVHKTIEKCHKNPELFLSVQDDLYEELKQCTKHLYDLAFKAKRRKQSKIEILPELIVDGFDAEQIWQQLELANNEVFNHVNLGELNKIFNSKKPLVLPFKVRDDTDDDKPTNEETANDENEEEQEVVSEKSENNDTGNNDRVKRTKSSNKIKKRRRTTEVDDKFFKLDELDEYLQKEDKREMSEKKDKDSSDEESIDLFNDFSEEEDIEDDEMENEKMIKYADFFDSPESDEGDEEAGNDREYNENNKENNEDESDDDYNENESDTEYNANERYKEYNENKNEENREYESNDYDKDDRDKSNNVHAKEINGEKSKKDKKKVKFNLLNESDEEKDEEGDEEKDEEKDGEKDEENKNKFVPSTLELRQERLKKRISELEESAIAKKPWQMMGEASAQNRPQNSLLEEYVEFDSATRPAPIITEQTTMKLEDIIKTRIKDKSWDDVEKKFKPVETPLEFKKKLIMNQEKSKESLAQIYENEYVKQREALNLDDKEEEEKVEPPEHIEIRKEMHDLFAKLDALSNYHYTPKMAQPEIKIVSNLPAINMEEVAPVATTDATLLAPEEIQPKQRGELIGKSERTKTDMKRERRKKKLRQHARAVNESKKETENKRKKSSKYSAVLEKLKGRNVIDATEADGKRVEKSLKSSTAFFARLQDEVENTIKRKTSKNDGKKKNDKNTLSAVRLKL